MLVFDFHQAFIRCYLRSICGYEIKAQQLFCHRFAQIKTKPNFCPLTTRSVPSLETQRAQRKTRLSCSEPVPAEVISVLVGLSVSSVTLW